MKPAKNTHTVGLDLGDKAHESCTLAADGGIADRSAITNDRTSLAALCGANAGAFIVMEAGWQLSRPGGP